MVEILVIPKKDYYEYLENRPTDFEFLHNIKELIQRKGLYIERSLAEKDIDYLQIIPYTIVKKDKSIFAYTRLKKGTEERLHSKMSIGVGGHVDKVESYRSPWEMTVATVIDELYQELEIETSTEFLSPNYNNLLIYDPSNDVGKVHLGLLYSVDVENREVSVKETEKLEGRFYTVEELKKLYEDNNQVFETWTAIVLNYLGIISYEQSESNK